MNTPHNIAILLATYNGAQYIGDLLRSLENQSYHDWLLYVQDDGSTDETMRIVQRFAETDSRITIYNDGDKQRGALKNFMSLLQHCHADYYMFCDQDDVWLEEKIELTLKRMKEEEALYPEQPIVVHTDLTVTDAELNVIQPSFWEMSRIAPQLIRNFNQLAGHFLTTGCTMMLNEAAKALAFPFREALMHDAWITARVLYAGGWVVEVPRSTILYRQHGHNTIGAKDKQHHYLSQRLKRLDNVLQENRAYYRMLRVIGYGSCFKYLYYKIAYYLAYQRLHRQ